MNCKQTLSQELLCLCNPCSGRRCVFKCFEFCGCTSFWKLGAVIIVFVFSSFSEVETVGRRGKYKLLRGFTWKGCFVESGLFVQRVSWWRAYSLRSQKQISSFRGIYIIRS